MPRPNEPAPLNAQPLSLENGDQLLLPQHAALLSAAGLSPAVIQQRGYCSAREAVDLQRLGFSHPQCRVPALVIPVWDLDGAKCLHQARPDNPRRNKDGNWAKYELPKGSKRVIDVPPGARDRVLDGTSPLYVTVGIRQADVAVSQGLCCIALLGNSGWKDQEPFWDRVPLDGRVVRLVFDSDVSRKIEVWRQASELREFLAPRRASVHIVLLPPRDDGAKMGLDDFFNAGHSVEDLLALSAADVPTIDCIEPGIAPQYVRTKQGLCVVRHNEDKGSYLQPLCNCDIRIAVELTVTNGISARKELEIEATLDGETDTIHIPVEDFNRMDWVVQYLGARAVIYAGNGIKEHLRAAIQMLSLDTMATRTVYQHTGWIFDHLGCRQFVHAGGAIGAEPSAPLFSTGPQGDNAISSPGNGLRNDGPMGPIGPQKQSRAILPPIARLEGPLAMFRLPDSPSRPVLQEAVRASLNLLRLAPDHIAMPLLGATYRAPLGDLFYTVGVDGITGRGKTTYAALFQQHFGPEMTVDALPGSWRCTPNYLEALAFLAKDALFTVDDLAPTGSKADVERLNRDAESFLRSVGDT